MIIKKIGSILTQKFVTILHTDIMHSIFQYEISKEIISMKYKA